MLATSLPTLHDRIVYIHNSVNPSLLKPADAGSAAALSPYILCIAELQEYKGIDVLLHATQLLLETDPDLVLILRRRPAAAKLGGFGARARHPSSRIVSWHAGSARTGYAASRMPRRRSLHRGWSRSGLPFSRHWHVGGRLWPVRSAAIPEMIEHEVSGLLVEPEDPKALAAGLRRVLDDEKLAYRLAANGYAGVMKRFCSVHQGTA